MQVAVLGTGIVGTTVGSGLLAGGHQVGLGSRTADNEAAAAWAAQAGTGATHGTFAAVVRDAEVVVNAVRGESVLAALDSVGADLLGDKVLLDASNPLDFSRGFPPTVDQPGGLSLGERIQARFPHARVVKALNTVTASVMVDPGSLAEPTALFLAGDDEAAKRVVRGLLTDLGWVDDQLVDLGDITAARGTELYLALWVRLMQAQGTASFNIRVVR